MFSQTMEYALRAVVFLAGQAPVACTTEQIARGTKVPQAYLSKVIQALNRGGIVHSQRGLGGGITLIKRPDELTMYDVVNAVDPVQRIETCPLGLAQHGVRLCPLHHRLDAALRSVELALRETTLAAVLADTSDSVPLCVFPANKPEPTAT